MYKKKKKMSEAGAAPAASTEAPSLEAGAAAAPAELSTGPAAASTEVASTEVLPTGPASALEAAPAAPAVVADPKLVDQVAAILGTEKIQGIIHPDNNDTSAGVKPPTPEEIAAQKKVDDATDDQKTAAESALNDAKTNLDAVKAKTAADGGGRRRTKRKGGKKSHKKGKSSKKVAKRRKSRKSSSSRRRRSSRKQNKH